MGASSSPWAVHYNSGSCMAVISIVATSTPRYDVERLGINRGHPGHANVLLPLGGDKEIAGTTIAYLSADV